MWHRRVIHLTLIVLLATMLPARAETHLKEGDVVAVCGDSITEQKLYSVYIENYLLACKPQQNVRVAQFGWSGEVAPGFLGRMKNDVLWIKPTVATTCYGMNDGGYSPMDEAKAKRYRNAMLGIVKTFKEAGVRTIIIGSPGCVDTDFFKRVNGGAEMYNKTLSELRDIAKQIAAEEGVVFADVFDAMYTAMPKAKEKLGSGYNVCGADGFHPGPNGQLIMAYAFLKAMGCDGNIGTITIDAQSGKAEATEGHKVLASDSGTVELESTRYPFCFYGNETSPDGTRSIIPFIPFNEELNRYTLVVKNAASPKVKVTWGNASKEFGAEELAKGINLAAAFVEHNPFSEPFRQVEQAVRAQQNYETPLHKVTLHNLAPYFQLAPEEKEALDRIAGKAQAKDKELFDQTAAAVKPVKHVIRIEAVK
jgi:lysophospholipase L1-like esterase